MPPKPFPKSSKTLAAEKYGPDCPALYSTPRNTSNALANAVQATLSQVGHTQNEDCLTINIWTKPQTGEKKKAILVGPVSNDSFGLAAKLTYSSGFMGEVSRQERLITQHITGKTLLRNKTLLS
jgi:hypothetical protein